MKRLALHQFNIDIKKYKKGKKIKRGGFGSVYYVTNIETGSEYAAKVIDCCDDQEQLNKIFDREVKIMMNINHPTLVKLIGYSTVDFHDEQNMTLIMELAVNGSLQDVIEKIQANFGPHDYTNTSRQIILIGIARGMKYLHDRYIIHRDLKAGNVLLNDNFYPLITDFGMSKIMEVSHTYNQSIYGGTVPYMAPEIHKGLPYGPKADVYSFAILMFEVLTDSLAYPELHSGKLSDLAFRNKVVNENYRPKFTIPIKESHKKLIEECWSSDPEKRPNFDEIFERLINKNGNEDCFLEGVDFDEIKNYIEDITEIFDPFEKVLSEKKELEKKNQKLKDEKRELEKEKEHAMEQILIAKQILPRKPVSIRPKRIKEANVLFIIDSTKCNKSIIHSIYEKVEDIAFDYRISNRRAEFLFSSICYTDVGKPIICNFTDLENLSSFLEKTEGVINDLPGNEITTPVNYVDLLITGYRMLLGREGKRLIVWIASRPAQGKKFCGENGHENEEEELIHIVKELSNDRIYFHGLFLNERTKKTFDEMELIYEFSRNFIVRSFDESEYIIDLFDY